MREYGGYIEFEYYDGQEYHLNAIALNSGRNCLAHLIDVRKIAKIYLPHFLCDSVILICKKKGIEIEFYNIDKDFKPIFDKKLHHNEYLYIVNYYGVLDDNYILQQKTLNNNIILDNAQAFFRKAISGVDTIYVARKFFGVSDGAYLMSDCGEDGEYVVDTSHGRMLHLLGRFETTASEFYMNYKSNEEKFDDEPVKYMSKLTHNFLKGINYERVIEKRNRNYKFLLEKFKNVNLIEPTMIDGAFAYPLLIDKGCDLRERLHQNRIYIPQLWPDVIERCDTDSIEYYYAQNILPIPVDQRYQLEDMEYIANMIIKCQETL